MIRPSYRLLLLVLCFAMHFSQADAAELKTGIYRLDKHLDSATLEFLRDERHYITKPGSSEMHAIDYTQHLYTPLLDEGFQADYVVIVKDRSEASIPRYKAVLLNRSQPDYIQNIYSAGGAPRKYTELSFAIEIASEFECWYLYQTEMEGFYAPYFDSDRLGHGQDDLGTINGKKYGYRQGYEDHNFYSIKDRFFWKSHALREYFEPVPYMPKGATFDGQLVAGQFYTSEQQLAAFTLVQEQPYIDLLPIEANVTFHTATTTLTLTPGDFVAINAEEDEWYRGDHITPEGEVTSGSIFIDDLLPETGVHAKMTVHKLTLDIRYSAKNEEDDYLTGVYQDIQRIKIYDSTGKLVQVLKYPGLIINEEHLLDTVDVNFDGYVDLEIFAHNGGAGPNYGNNYYIYNPQTDLFDYNADLSDLTQPSVSPKEKLIYSAYRDGAAIHGQEKYAWINGKLTRVEFYETYYLDDDNVSVTHYFLVNGEMKGETKIIKASELEGK